MPAASLRGASTYKNGFKLAVISRENKRTILESMPFAKSKDCLGALTVSKEGTPV